MVVDFIQRVTGYPVVSSAVGQASSYYSWVKDRHAYIRSAADITENGLKLVASSTQPLLHRFEGRISSLDQLACQQLDRLESNYPVVREPTDKVVEKTYDYYNAGLKPKVDYVLTPVTAAVATVQQAKSFGMQKVSNARDYGLEKYKRVIYGKYGQAGLQQLQQLIAAADRYVDRCLPEEARGSANESGPGERSGAEGQAEPGDSVHLALAVSRKLRRRLYARAAKSVLRLGKPVGFAFDKVQEVKAEFWIKVEELEKSDANGVVPADGEEKPTTVDAAKAYLHRAQLLSAAGLRVTGEHLSSQLLQLPTTVRVSTQRGAREFRVTLAAVVEFVQHNRLTEYLFDRSQPSSSCSSSIEAADDDRRRSEVEQQQKRQSAADVSFEGDALETTDDTVDDSGSEASE